MASSPAQTFSSEETPPLIAHLERHLGPIARGHRAEAPKGIQVSLFEHRPIGDATTYCTLGLSRHLLQDANGRDYRLELVGSSYARFDDLTPYANLFAVSEDVLAEHRALLRGQVLGPRGPIVRGSTLEAFYCAQPVYFPDELAVFRESEPATTLVWLVPISHAEAHFVWQHGWSAFEDLLVERDPDLLDLNRVSLV